MADENKESILDTTTDNGTATKTEAVATNVNEQKPVKAEKTSNVKVNITLNMIVMILSIATLVLAVLTAFIACVSSADASTVVRVFMCITYVALAGTLVVYLVDYLKNKSFSFNPAFIVMLLAVVATFGLI